MSNERIDNVTASVTHRKYGTVTFILSGLERDIAFKLKEDLAKELDTKGVYDLFSLHDVAYDLLQKYEEKYHYNTHPNGSIGFEILI